MKTFVFTLFIFVTNFISASEPNSIVVMLGDSTTDQGLPWVVMKELNQKLKIPLSRKGMINAGKGGDNATSALRRLELDVLAHKPNIVTVSFGLNDTGGRKPKEYGQSIRKIVRTLKTADINVILMTSTPFNNERHFGQSEKYFKNSEVSTNTWTVSFANRCAPFQRRKKFSSAIFIKFSKQNSSETLKQ